MAEIESRPASTMNVTNRTNMVDAVHALANEGVIQLVGALTSQPTESIESALNYRPALHSFEVDLKTLYVAPPQTISSKRDQMEPFYQNVSRKLPTDEAMYTGGEEMTDVRLYCHDKIGEFHLHKKTTLMFDIKPESDEVPAFRIGNMTSKESSQYIDLKRRTTVQLFPSVAQAGLALRYDRGELTQDEYEISLDDQRRSDEQSVKRHRRGR